jgi:hypothetical protein
MRRTFTVLFVLAAILAVIPITVRAETPSNLESVYKKGQARLVEVMKIGGGEEEGDEPPVFYTPMAPCVARDGTIYVLDYETKEILVFSREGKYQFKFARAGEGPGEFQWPTNVGFDHVGRLVVSDSGNKRFTLFTPHGKLIKTVSFFADDVGDFAYLPDGRMVAEVGRRYMASPAAMGTNWSVMLLDSTFQAIAALDSCKGEMVVVNTSKGTTVATPPFRNYLVWTTSPDGRIFYGRANEYRISVVDDRLKSLRTITRTVAPVKITAEDRKKYNDKMSAEIVSAVHFPDSKPPVEALFCDNAGYLLVYRAMASGSKTVVLDVYRPDGSFLGELSVPGFRYPVFDADTILMRVSSKNELPAVIRYRLE